jgi:insulysin
LLKVKTIKDTRTLHLEFPTIRLIDHHASKPDKLIAWLLGYEGKGSLLSQLKAEGLALGLSAGGGFVHPNVNSLNVSVSLTQVGVERYERVLELIFSYVDLLKKRGIDEATFKERQTMAQIDFDWKNPDEGMWFVAGKASALHHYPLAEVETLPHLFVKYDPAIYRSVLDTLTPENALVSLETNSVAVDQTEKYYGTEYSLTEVDGESFARLKNPTAPSAIAYPVANPFIPYGLQLVEEKPHLVKDDPMGKVWFLFDHRFNQPKVYLSLRLETPLTYDTVEHYVLAKLYNAAVLEALNEEMYPIEMAGLSYSLSVNKEGVVIGLGGYSQSITHLVRLVSQNLVRPKIDERQFNDLKEAGLRAMRNGKLGQAVARGAYYSNLFWFKKTYDEDAQIRAMTPVTLKDVLEYAGHLYERVHVAGMGHGNWSEEGVRASVDTLLKEIKSGPLPEAERYKEEVEVLVRGEKIRFSQKAQDNNNAMAYILQAGERDFERQAKLALIGYIVESDFFTQMRTNQQLGYLVSSFQRRREDRLFFNFVIQSATYSSFELANRVEAWLAASAKLFDTLSDEDFEKFRAALITSIEKRGDSIAEVLGDWYYLAVEEKADFDFKKKYLAAAKRVAKSDVKALAHELFLDPVTPRLQILIRSKANEEAVPPGVFSDVPAIKNRRSAATDKAVVGK